MTAQPIVTPHPQGIVQIDADYIAPGIASVYLIREGDRLALVEAGTASTVPHVLAVIEQLGLTPDHLDYILPTHVHLDHAAGVGGLMQACPDARLIVHPRGAAHMIDPSKLEAATRVVYGDEQFERLYGTLIPVPAERVTEASDGMTVDLNGRTLTFMDTPGHARHHYCVHDAGSKGVFSGDTFGLSYRAFDKDDGCVFHFVTTTPVHFDPDAMRDSIQRIAALQPSAVYLTHYGPVQANDDNLQQLEASLQAFVDIALAEKGQPEGRVERLTRNVLDWLVNKSQQRGHPLSETDARRWLKADADLNAQGLDVWLQRLEKV